LRDDGAGSIKAALRDIVDRFRPNIQLTADQDLLLEGIVAADKAAVESVLDSSGFSWRRSVPLLDRAMACVSLPTCTLALAEAERVLPATLSGIQQGLERHGLASRAPLVRLTGCPNGCARPYNAEIGIVGMASDRYAIFLGGSVVGVRLARPWVQKIPGALIAQTLDPVFLRWKDEGLETESLGDFVHRVGIESLRP
jgi:sulfite reductase beta subunit-like hemoprotein